MIRLMALLLLAASGEIDSAHVIALIEPPSERLNPPVLFAPGAPPLLSFRYFNASDRGRFGNLGLMMDDAGH